MIYLDNASSTIVSKEVKEAMLPFFDEQYGNSSSLHLLGRSSSEAVANSRMILAKSINAEPSEIYFTSSGSEANTWAITGIIRANKARGKHIITSIMEHESTLETCKYLENEGYQVTYVEVDKSGIIDIEKLKNAIRPDTVLISIMSANNEIGTLQNIQEIAKIAHAHNILFHTDAVQAFAFVDFDVKNIGIDLMSVSAHKINGPKGIGFLYVKKGIKIDNILFGGNQEFGKRGGTVNVPAVVGFGKACEILMQNKKQINQKILELKQYFLEKLEKNIKNIKINGKLDSSIPSICSVTFSGVNAEILIMLLDVKGVLVSRGSACTAGSVLPSNLLMAISSSEEEAKSIVRFSFSVYNTFNEIDTVIEILKETIQKMRDKNG